jgi:phosphatidylethanolamine/phosphatidyl-N-methylethanolamine N-methyltransferase
MTETVARYLHFFWAGLSKHGQTGGLIPSQRFLIEKMLSPIPEDYAGHCIELGTGCGALTLRLAAKCPKARITACEINPVLARDTRRLLQSQGFDQQVHVVNQPAEDLLAQVAAENGPKPDFVISGIPLATLSDEATCTLLNAIREALPEGGMYIQFQHSLLDKNRIRCRFAQFRSTPVFRNVPPAVVYYARKESGGG